MTPGWRCADLLEVAQPRHVLLERLAARAGARARERVGGLDEHRLDGLRLDLVVVGLDRVRDRLVLAVAAHELAADQGVRALDLVRDRLADVVQQGGAARGLHRRAQLLGHHRGELRGLDQVVEDVLAVAGAELELAEHLRQLGVEAVDLGLEHGALALLGDDEVDLALRLLVGLLAQRRVDAPVGDQLLERQARDLAPHAVEAREHDRGRRLVDDQVDAGEALEGADVAPLAADDPPLHLVVGKLDQARRRLAGVRRREALHRDREDVAGAALGLLLGLGVDALDRQPGLVAGLLLDLLHEDLLGLRDREAGDLLELAALDLLRALELVELLLEVSLAVVERLAAALELGELDVDRLGVSQRLLLHARDLRAAGAQLLGRGVVGRVRGRRGRGGRRDGTQACAVVRCGLPGGPRPDSGVSVGLARSRVAGSPLPRRLPVEERKQVAYLHRSPPLPGRIRPRFRLPLQAVR